MRACLPSVRKQQHWRSSLLGLGHILAARCGNCALCACFPVLPIASVQGVCSTDTHSAEWRPAVKNQSTTSLHLEHFPRQHGWVTVCVSAVQSGEGLWFEHNVHVTSACGSACQNIGPCLMCRHPKGHFGQKKERVVLHHSVSCAIMSCATNPRDAEISGIVQRRPVLQDPRWPATSEKFGLGTEVKFVKGGTKLTADLRPTNFCFGL
uniref:Uncharacterized protein n=1 Tax=Eutreptiella gymnastica TaxID=73025 RepID=A0A7S4LN16_9EUGL